jgi:beta-fructofuranosidase
MELSADEFFYAPNSLLDDRGRRLMWGWLVFGSSDGSPWQGIHTLPRELTLDSDLTLRQWPAKEVTKLREETLFDRKNVTLEAGESLELAPGNLLEVELTLPAGSTGHIRLEVLRAPDVPRLTPITFDCATGELHCGGRSGQVTLIPDQPIVLRVFLDRHLLEVYAAGRGVLSERAAPQLGDLGVRLIAEDAPLSLTSIRQWRMEAIWQSAEAGT